MYVFRQREPDLIYDELQVRTDQICTCATLMVVWNLGGQRRGKRLGSTPVQFTSGTVSIPEVRDVKATVMRDQAT